MNKCHHMHYVICYKYIVDRSILITFIWWILLVTYDKSKKKLYCNTLIATAFPHGALCDDEYILQGSLLCSCTVFNTARLHVILYMNNTFKQSWLLETDKTVSSYRIKSEVETTKNSSAYCQQHSAVPYLFETSPATEEKRVEEK
jgi:hypothetical protein